MIPSPLRKLLLRPALWWTAVACWAAFLFLYGSFSGPQGGPDIPHLDKVLHFVYYAGGATGAGLALACASGGFRRWHAAVAVGVAALVGVLDEFYQSFFPHRTGNDLGDLTADILGGVAGYFLSRLLYRLFTARAPSAPAPDLSPPSPGR